MTEGRINTERRHRKRWRLQLECGKENPQLIFFIFSPPDCLISPYVQALICARARGGDWGRWRERRGNRCSTLLGGVHTGGRQRESPILAQQYYGSAAVSTTMAAQPSQPGAIDLVVVTQYTHSQSDCRFNLSFD